MTSPAEVRLEKKGPSAKNCGLVCCSTASVGLAIALALVIQSGSCGATRDFVWRGDVLPAAEKTNVTSAVRAPDGCNSCAKAGDEPVWATLGKLCDLRDAVEYIGEWHAVCKDLKDVFGGVRVKACVPRSAISEFVKLGLCTEITNTTSRTLPNRSNSTDSSPANSSNATGGSTLTVPSIRRGLLYCV